MASISIRANFFGRYKQTCNLLLQDTLRKPNSENSSPIHDANDSEDKVVIEENISDKYEYLSYVSDHTMPVVSFSSQYIRYS